MKLPGWLVKIAEIIFKGRQAGLWTEKDKLGQKRSKLDKPHRPGR